MKDKKKFRRVGQLGGEKVFHQNKHQTERKQFSKRKDQSVHDNDDFEEIVEDIQSRGATFVRMGFTSEERRSNKKVLGDIFHVYIYQAIAKKSRFERNFINF